mmetsp:Transcript_6935/g.13715  ORF Transcript_6935/g.13715 Transcript_6935/m.13715 type:complete len:86 (+) Transcript_6935:501-758(+)
MYIHVVAMRHRAWQQTVRREDHRDIHYMCNFLPVVRARSLFLVVSTNGIEDARRRTSDDARTTTQTQHACAYGLRIVPRSGAWVR